MGDPKKIRKKYETPSQPWDSVRIQQEHELKEKYGLKTLRELWMPKSEIRRTRKNIREVLSGKSSERTGKEIIAKLNRYNVVKSDATLDDLLVIDVTALLERRLQTIVFRKGLAKTMKQARQLTAHGLISINGKRVASPGHLVLASEEAAIGYYKPFVLQQSSKESSPAVVANASAQSTEAAKPAEESTETAQPTEENTAPQGGKKTTE